MPIDFGDSVLHLNPMNILFMGFKLGAVFWQSTLLVSVSCMELPGLYIAPIEPLKHHQEVLGND